MVQEQQVDIIHFYLFFRIIFVDNKKNYAKVTATSGWGFCTVDCQGLRNSWTRKLQIADQSVLHGDDCNKLCRLNVKIMQVLLNYKYF